MFKNEVRTKEKLFMVKVGGFFKEDEAAAFLEDYLAKYKSINPREYSLVLDCKDLAVSGQNMIPVLKQRLEMYISQGFKKVYFVKLKSPTGMLQLRKVGEESGFWNKVELVDSSDDVIVSA